MFITSMLLTWGGSERYVRFMSRFLFYSFLGALASGLSQLGQGSLLEVNSFSIAVLIQENIYLEDELYLGE